LDHLYSSAIFTDYFRKKNIPNLAVASPDVGGIKMARSYAKRLGADLILIDKRRPKANEVEVMNVIGNAEGKNVLIVDDLIDTAGTFVNAVKALKDSGAKQIYGACTHPILSGKAIERLTKSDVKLVIVTDSIPKRKECAKIEYRSASKLFAEAIIRTHDNKSISSLFDVDKDKN
jgi:ribose-phosphate pyrophosphokinase